MFMLAAGSADPATAFMMLGIYVVIIVGAIIFVSIRSSRSKRNLTALAGRLGFTTSQDVTIPTVVGGAGTSFGTITADTDVNGGGKRGIAGMVRNHKVRFFEYHTGSGRSRRDWAVLGVAARSNDFVFTFEPDNVFYKVVEVLGYHEIQVGDVEFDRRWRINASNREILLALLLPELRVKIDEQALSSGSFFLENGVLRYRERGTFADEQRLRRMENMLGLMGDLADAVEVATKGLPPHPSLVPEHGSGNNNEKKDDDWGEKSPDYDDTP